PASANRAADNAARSDFRSNAAGSGIVADGELEPLHARASRDEGTVVEPVGARRRNAAGRSIDADVGSGHAEQAADAKREPGNKAAVGCAEQHASNATAACAAAELCGSGTGIADVERAVRTDTSGVAAAATGIATTCATAHAGQ